MRRSLHTLAATVKLDVCTRQRHYLSTPMYWQALVAIFDPVCLPSLCIGGLLFNVTPAFDLSDGVEIGMTAGLPQGFDTALDLEEEDLDGDYDSAEGGPDGEQVPGEVPTQTSQERTVKAYLVKYTAYRTFVRGHAAYHPH